MVYNDEVVTFNMKVKYAWGQVRACEIFQECRTACLYQIAQTVSSV